MSCSRDGAPRDAKGSVLGVLVGMAGGPVLSGALKDEAQVPAAVLQMAAHLVQWLARSFRHLLVALALQVEKAYAGPLPVVELLDRTLQLLQGALMRKRFGRIVLFHVVQEIVRNVLAVPP